MTRLEVTTVADGLARQHLRDDAGAGDVAQVARDLVGLHGTGAPNPYLQLLVRLSNFERRMLDRELHERRSLAGIRCMRGTCSCCRSICCRSHGRQLVGSS